MKPPCHPPLFGTGRLTFRRDKRKKSLELTLFTEAIDLYMFLNCVLETAFKEEKETKYFCDDLQLLLMKYFPSLDQSRQFSLLQYTKELIIYYHEEDDEEWPHVIDFMEKSIEDCYGSGGTGYPII